MAAMVVALLIIGCIQVKQPSMAYGIKPCGEAQRTSVNDEFRLEKTADGINLLQRQNYVCCANVTITMKTEDRTIGIYEENVGEMCRCICPFEANITVTDTAGYERIEVYGIKFRDAQGYELLFNSTLPS